MMKNVMQGFLPLTKLLFRKDRIKILIWLVCVTGITFASALAYKDVYKTDADIKGFAITMENPAMQAMLGPGYELEEYTSIAQVFGHELLLFTVIAVAVMNILFVSRATRGDEEEGQMELVMALSVGRLSYIMAAVAEAVTVNLLLALGTGFGLYTLGLEGFTLEGSLLYGALLGGSGLFFAGITALFAQLMETARGATGYSFAVLIASYVIRAVGDAEVEMLSLFSPLGWVSRAYVFVDNHWGPVILFAGAAVILILVSFYLNSVRDLFSGFFRPKRGKIHASPYIKNPLGFVLHQQRMNIIAWALGIFFLSAAFGSIMGELESYFSDLELMQMMFQHDQFSFMEQFSALLMGIMALFGVIPGMICVLGLKGEEKKNRTELIFSRPVSRNTVMATYISAAAVITVIMQLMTALGFWFAGSAVMDEAFTAGDIFRSALVYFPAMWSVIALTTFLTGSVPRFSATVWLYFGFCFLVVYFKETLQMPEWLVNLSVFEHIPEYPLEDITVKPVVILILLAAAVSIAGFFGYNRRDLTG